MIIREFYTTREDGVNLFKTYSDKNVYIRKVGTDETYTEAIDVENTSFVYEETVEEITEPSVTEFDNDESEVEV